MNAPKVPSGPGPWMRFAREMIAYADWLKPITGQGTLVGQGSNGRPVNVRAQPSPPSETSTTPLKTINGLDGSTQGIRVIYGTIAALVPSGMSPGDDPPFILTGMSGEGFVYGELDTDSDGSPVSAEIAFDSEVPDDIDPNGDGTSANFFFEIGSYSVQGDGSILVAKTITGSQAYTYCNGPLFGVI